MCVDLSRQKNVTTIFVEIFKCSGPPRFAALAPFAGAGESWQRTCSLVERVDKEAVMLESVRKSIAMPAVPARTLFSVGALGSFGWLLAHDLIHPLVIYLLQIYLTF